MKKILCILCVIILGICSAYAINVVYNNGAVMHNFVYGEYVRTRGDSIILKNGTLYGVNFDNTKIVEVDEALPVDFEYGKYALSSGLTTYILIGE
jgi:hypothetical protein